MAAHDAATPETVESLLKTGFHLFRVSDDLRDQLDRTFTAGGQFFRSPLESKSGTGLPGDSGYRPFGIEYSASPDRPDQMESFTVSHRTSNDYLSLPPGAARELSKAMCDLKARIEQIAQDLLEVIQARYMKSKQNRVSQFSRWSILQLNFSQPSRTPERCINELHEDGCLFTIAAVTSPGLEVRMPDGSFEPISTSHDQLLLMAGEILTLLSGGEIASCYHRVKTIPYLVDRMSLLMFADIDPKFCTPWIEAKINAGIDVGAKVLTNATRFGLTEWPPEANSS